MTLKLAPLVSVCTSPLSFSSSPTLRTSTLGLLLALTAVGCTTGQIGGEVDLEPDDDLAGQEGDSCEAVATTDVAADEETSLGLVAEEIAAAIEGTHEAPLDWGTNVPGSLVTATPESGASNITVTIEVLRDSAQVVDLEPKRADGDGDGAAIEIETPPCEDELRIDALVTVVTENGALNETLPATFASTDGILIRSRIDLPDELEGSFSVDVSGLENGKHSEWLDLSFVLGTMSGDVSGMVESNNGEVAMAGSAEYGRFPIESCAYGYLVDPESEWATELQTILAAHSEFELAWDGGSSTSMTVTPSFGQFCYEADPYSSEATLSVALPTEVSTTDGSISGSWDLLAQVTLLPDGSLATISVLRDNYLGATYPVESFASETGITGFDSSADALSFQFGYVIDVAEGQPAYGSMAILEATVPECAQPGYEPEVVESPDGGQSSPGCAGADFTEIATATLTAVSAESE